MQPLLELARHPDPPALLLGGILAQALADPLGQADAERFGRIDSHVECQLGRVGVDDEDRPRRDVSPLDDAVEVDQGNALDHGLAQPLVVAMARVGAAVLVTEQIPGEGVVVRPRRRRGDRQGQPQIPGLEDSLGPHEVDPPPLALETPLEELARQHVAVDLHLLREPVEGLLADARVQGVRGHGPSGPASLPQSSRLASM
ncbi:MAG: hypothetical protein OXG13_18175 [Gemmatimonadaceae bacterium]|nr:hypothetical protein [Gemmatimonadaceae bacterium]